MFLLLCTIAAFESHKTGITLICLLSYNEYAFYLSKEVLIYEFFKGIDGYRNILIPTCKSNLNRNSKCNEKNQSVRYSETFFRCQKISLCKCNFAPLPPCESII